jgi:flagellar basal-body rod protein FlgF
VSACQLHDVCVPPFDPADSSNSHFDLISGEDYTARTAPDSWKLGKATINQTYTLVALVVHINCRGHSMNSGYYAACTGLISRTEALDTIANNLANVSATGFRARHNVFSSVLATTDNTSLTTLNQDVNDYGVLSGTRLDSSQGALERTGNDLDVAIEGPGYLSVQTAKGTAYTRAGNLRLSPQGQLVTATGDAVLGENGPITILSAPVSISADGTITANGAIAGRLKLVEFAPTVDLQNSGNNYYTAPVGAAQIATSSQVRQGSIESSNVNPVTSVVELVSAQREVETMRRVLTMFSSELDKTAVQDLPRVS